MSQHEYAGCQFDKKNIASVIQEIERQKASRRDYIYPATKLSMSDDGGLCFLGSELFQVGDVTYTEWKDAEAAADTSGQELKHLGKGGSLLLSPTAEAQLAAKLQIPMPYTKKLRAVGHNDLAAHNFSTLLSRDNRKFLVRTLDGRVRAVLSNSYKVMDNSDLFFCAAEEFQKCNAEIWSARLWEHGFELFATAQHISGKVRTDRPFNPGDGWMSRWHGNEGDVQNAAVRVRNSETGQGKREITPAILRRVCANFCVWMDGIANIHLGKAQEEEGKIGYSDETLQSESKTVWLKIRDVIRTAFDANKFKEYINRLNNITQQEIHPQTAVENLVKAYQISEVSKANILASLLASGDKSRYGVVQAVTFQAHALDELGKPEEASFMEDVGSELIWNDKLAKDLLKVTI